MYPTKLERELAAQKKRVEALTYLSKNGASNSEILKLVSKGKPTISAQPAKTVDNTLECLFKQNLKQYEQKNLSQLKADLLKHQYGKSSSSINSSSTSTSGLPSSWQELKCPNTGEFYYWNKLTNETKWEKPTDSSAETVTEKPLLAGWLKKKHPATGQVFYLHEASGGIRSTAPTDTDFFTDEYKSSLKKETAATAKSDSSTASKSTAATTSFSLKRKSTDTDNKKSVSNKRKEVDPLDWMSGNPNLTQFNPHLSQLQRVTV